MPTQNQEQLQSQLQRVPIAIIGMAGLFPQAKNLQEYWNNIIREVDCITDVPASRWNTQDYYDPDPTAPDKTYCKRGGFIPDIDFNPLEFGLPPNILEVTDVAQLLSLVIAKSALEDAGYGDSRNFSRERTGVVLGVVGGCMQLITPLSSRLQYPVWQKVLKSSGLSDEDTQKIIEKMKLAYVGWEENSFPGWLANVVAGRIANRLNLGGMNCVVDAACASSMSAVKMSISELLEGRCDMMITGGVEADNSIFNYMCFSKTPASSKKDFLNPFDAESDGMMVGEGIGMLVLKRLADAERDGDRIYAVIKGIGTGSDGKYKSIYAPRPEGQAKTLRRAYEDAGIPYTSIGLIEAHGTGTPAGDLCEFTALKEVFSENNPQKQHIALGSVKSQIGHTKAAAGAASIIKTALAIYHKVLPPTINVKQPNPKFGVEDSPFYLNTEVRPWLQSDPNIPRRAGVSSFGFGGTNYHIVLEEYNQEQSRAYRLHTTPESVLIWADTPEQLLVKCELAKSQLESATANQYYQELINSSKSANIPIAAARVGFVATSQVEAGELLQLAINCQKKQPQATSWEHPRGVYYRQVGMSLKGKVVALFPGQGSQYLNMGRQLAINFPPLRQAYKSLDELLIQDGLQPLSQTVFPRPTFDSEEKTNQTQALQRTENAQPAIGAFSAGLYKVLQQAGFKADFVAGHSFGELTALWAAGVLNDADYFYLVKARGQAMSTPKNCSDYNAGTMLAVNGEIRKIPEIVKGLSHVHIANFNSPNQVVLSGAIPEIGAVQQILNKRGYSVTQLPVSAAFHSRFVSHACEPFANAVRSVNFNSPKIPVYSNTTGEAYSTQPEIIQKTLENHLLQSVLFEQEIENIYAAGGYCFVEIGPRQILTNFVKATLGDRPHLAIALNPSRDKDSDLQLRQAVIQLRIAGLSLQDIDPYQLESQISEVTQGSRVSITLNGSNYVSEKTKAAFEQALQDGHQIQPNILNSAESQTDIQHSLENKFEQNYIIHSSLGEVIDSNTNLTSQELTDVNVSIIPSEQPELINDNINALSSEFVTVMSSYVMTETVDSTDSSSTIPMIESNEMLQPIYRSGSDDQIVSNAFEKLVTQFCHHQSQILRVHEQYLKSQAECSQSFFQLMQQQYRVLLDGHNIKSQAVELAPTPTPTNNVVEHNTPVEAPQINLVNNSLSVAPPAKVETSPEIKPVATVKTADRVELLLQAISGKTGYPVTLLNWEMNPYADLGIDAVKWMDIISAIEELIPDVPKVNPKELAQQPTLRQAAEYIQIRVPQAIPSPQVSVTTTASSIETVVLQPVESAPVVAASQSVKTTEDTSITESLLNVISDKTGYPAEMLEPEMDLEADLGVDSIKRVEIIGAMQTLFSNLPKLSPEELGEQRTIGKIANYLGAKIAEAKKKCLTPA